MPPSSNHAAPCEALSRGFVERTFDLASPALWQALQNFYADEILPLKQHGLENVITLKRVEGETLTLCVIPALTEAADAIVEARASRGFVSGDQVVTAPATPSKVERVDLENLEVPD